MLFCPSRQTLAMACNHKQYDHGKSPITTPTVYYPFFNKEFETAKGQTLQNSCYSYLNVIGWVPINIEEYKS